MTHLPSYECFHCSQRISFLIFICISFAIEYICHTFSVFFRFNRLHETYSVLDVESVNLNGKLSSYYRNDWKFSDRQVRANS